MSEQLAAGRATGGDYESIPYDSMPFAQTQPSNLAALANFFGLDAAPVDTCRVLELGCASGGNIIPLAARYPRAQFTGVDISDRHVAIAAERIGALGLTNIDIRRGDVADRDTVEGEYDYIIAHGLYSWVPPAVQGSILDIFGHRLAPDGLAYISYNVLPGWQLRKVIRETLLFHVGRSGSPQVRVARAREMLQQLAAISRESTLYGQLIRHEAKQLAALPDSYILGEFLVDENHPCLFTDFLGRAERAGLAYLTDTDLRSALPETISPEFGHLLTSVAGNDQRMTEQYFDFFQGRQFRQSVLVRGERRSCGKRAPDPRRVAELHFSTQLRIERGSPTGEPPTLREPKGKSITTNDPMTAQAIDRLGAAFPETRTLAQLMGQLPIHGDAQAFEVRNRILSMLAPLIVSGLVFMSSSPLITGRADDERPVASRVARQEHAAGQSWVTNLRHMPVKVDETASLLLPLLDGGHDRERLMSCLRAAAADVDAASQLDRALQNLQQLAILETVGDRLRD